MPADFRGGATASAVSSTFLSIPEPCRQAFERSVVRVFEIGRPAELARRLGVSRREVHRLTDLRHSTKIDGVAKALRALGYCLELSLAKA